MGIFSKFILALFVFFVGVFIFFISFFQNPSSRVSDVISQSSFSPGVIFISEQTGDFKESQKSVGGSFVRQSISHLDSIFASSQDSYSLNPSTSKVRFGTGFYILDFRDITRNHQFSGLGFEANILGEGRVFIDSSKQDSVTIFSQSSTVKIKLIDQKGNFMSEVFLYPHMLLRFSPSKNQYIEKADIVRLASIHSLTYIKVSLFGQQSGVLFQEYFPDNLFFPTVWKYIQTLQASSQKQIQNISKIQVFQFPGLYYIEKYFSMFINQEKKKIYYKNRYLASVIDILQNGSNPKTLEVFNTELINISGFPGEYKQVQEVVKSLQFIYSYTYGIQSSESKKDLFKMQKGTGSMDFYDSSLILSTLYNTFDFSGEYSYTFLESFFTLHLSELGIDMKDLKTVSTSNRLYLDYLLFFLEKIFSGGFSLTGFENRDQEEGLLKIFSQYSKISPTIYNLGDNKKKVTALYIYVDILSNFEKYILDIFFEKNKNQNNTLIRKSSVQFSSENLDLIQASMNRIFSFYAQNRDFLDNNTKRDIFIARNLDILQKNISEYLSALEDYELYLFEYDKRRKDLLSLETGESDKTVFDEAYIKTYLSQFEGFDLKNIDISISSSLPLYAEIRGIIINNAEISFRMSSLSGKLIDSIVLDKKQIFSAYKLDEIQVNLKEKQETSAEKDKKMYDFSKFFINTFFIKDINTSETFVVPTSLVQEDPVVVVFKRDKLLGTKGEFASVISTLPITYDSIKVVENQTGTYDISLFGIMLSLLDSSSNSSAKYNFEFSSEYRISNNLREFFNIQLKPYKNLEQNSTAFDLSGVPIVLKQSISIKNFDAEMSKFLVHYPLFYNFYTSFSQDVPLENMKIDCILKGGIYTLSGMLLTDQITLRFSNNRILSVQINGKEKLSNSISSGDISQIKSILLTK